VSDIVGIPAQCEAVIELIPKTRHLTTVGLAGLMPTPGVDSSIWRVQRIVDVAELGVADDIRVHFPVVRDEDVVRVSLVPFGRISDAAYDGWSIEAPPGGGATWSVQIPFDPSRARGPSLEDPVVLWRGNDHGQRMAVGTAEIVALVRSHAGTVVQLRTKLLLETSVPLSNEGRGDA
jgi:hypothetical protein